MDNSTTTWKDAVDDYLVDVEYRLAPKTHHYYKTQLSPLVRWATGEGISLQQFRAAHLKAYLIQRGKDGVTDRTRHHDAIAACVMFKFAAKNNLIPGNPLDRYEKPRVGRASVPKPSVEDIQKVLAAIPKRWDIAQNDKARFLSPKQRRFYAAREYAIICCLIASAARIGEILALRVCDYDKAKKELVFRQTKGKTPRTVPISDTCVAVIEAWLKIRPRCDTDLMFFGNTGEALEVGAYGKIYARYVKYAAVPAHTLHGLRHYAATEIAKIDLYVAMKILGHKDPKTTTIYLHEDSEHVRKAYDKASPLDTILVEKRKAKKRRERVI